MNKNVLGPYSQKVNQNKLPLKNIAGETCDGNGDGKGDGDGEMATAAATATATATATT